MWIGAYEAMKKGVEQGMEQGRLEEKANTMREAERADAAEEEKKRAEALEKEVENLKHRLAAAGI